MKYSPKYFKENHPKEKNRSDSLLVRFVFRPISFLTSSLCANMGISANAISIFSLFVSLSACVLIFINNYICRIIGASLVLFWMILDVTDGNLARSVKKQKYGEFVDASACYWLLAFLYFSIGKCSYDMGGVVFQQYSIWPLIIGAAASIFDLLMRVTYHKFHESDSEINVGTTKPESKSFISKLFKIEKFFDKNIGINGFALLLVLFAIIFKFSDIFVMIYASFNLLILLSSTAYFYLVVIKSMKNDK